MVGKEVIGKLKVVTGLEFFLETGPVMSQVNLVALCFTECKPPPPPTHTHTPKGRKKENYIYVYAYQRIFGRAWEYF